MPVAAHRSTLKVSGQSTSMVDEPTTNLGGGVYQITSTARRIVDPAVAVTVKDGATVIASNLWGFDYLFGRVTFSGYSPTGAVTVSGSYLPTVAVKEAREVSFSASRDVLDRTSFDDADARTKAAGLKDLSGSLTVLEHASADLDAAQPGEQSWRKFYEDGAPKLLEFRADGASGDYFRAWILVEGYEESAAVDGLVEVSVTFAGTALAAVTDSDPVSFGWGQ